MNVQPTTTPIQVQIANQQYMQSTHTAEIPVQGIPPAARQVHVFPNMATNLLAPGPLVQQGCTLQMDSQQCLIQCPNCQPIQCPINSQGLYLLPATAYNTIDVDEYIDRANQARFAMAALALADNEDQSEHQYEDNGNQSRFATAAREVSEQAIACDNNHNRFAAANLALTDEEQMDLSETPKRSNVSRWAATNRFAALASDDEDEYDVTNSATRDESDTKSDTRDDPYLPLEWKQRADDDSEQTEQQSISNTSQWALTTSNNDDDSESEPPNLLRSSLSDDEDDDEPVVTPNYALSEHTTTSATSDADEDNQRAKDVMTVAMVATAMATTAQDPSSTPAEMVAFCHAAMYSSPAISTMETATKKGFLPPFTGLSEATLKK
jgi:hypothetical protein